MKKLALLTLALTLPACSDKTDSGAPDTGDSGTEAPVPLSIDTVAYDYDGNSWSYEVHCNGWADDVTMYITQDTVSPWDESHTLESRDYDPDGAWDVWGLDLDITNDSLTQTSGIDTLFGNSDSCENPYCETTMAWRIEARGGSTIKDCVVWAGAASDVSLVMETGCREITPE